MHVILNYTSLVQFCSNVITTNWSYMAIQVPSDAYIVNLFLHGTLVDRFLQVINNGNTEQRVQLPSSSNKGPLFKLRAPFSDTVLFSVKLLSCLFLSSEESKRSYGSVYTSLENSWSNLQVNRGAQWAQWRVVHLSIVRWQRILRLRWKATVHLYSSPRRESFRQLA